MSERDETPAEKQYRLRSEAECRRIGTIIKGELPPGLAFVLITADVGAGNTFSNTAYVSTARREDAARLLSELLDHFMQRGETTEPTIRTSSALRDAVGSLRELHWEGLLGGARRSVRDAGDLIRRGNTRDAIIALLKGAAELLAVFDQQLTKESEELARLRPPEGN
jgi:hypothetical protein